MKRTIGKYTIKFYSGLNPSAEISNGKTRTLLYELCVSEILVLQKSNEEKEIAHILKMRRIELKRKLAKIEKLLEQWEKSHTLIYYLIKPNYIT